MNIIAIDPSLICTALVINDKKFIYVQESNVLSEKTGKMKKWFELCSPFITYRYINYIKALIHSDQEIYKLIQYNEITDLIISDIISNINPSEDTKIGIEGYSYSSSSGPLIDLVTFSTLLRSKLYTKLSKNISILPPSSLKLAAAKLTYLPIVKGKKVLKYEYRNEQGISGGKFRKPEMYKALIDNQQLKSSWVEFLRLHHSDICGLNTVPKPIEDMNDAVLLYEILKCNK